MSVGGVFVGLVYGKAQSKPNRSLRLQRLLCDGYKRFSQRIVVVCRKHSNE